MSDNAESPTEPEKKESSSQQNVAGDPGDNGDPGKTEEKRKIDVLLKAVGDTPIMKTKKWAVERGRTVQSLAQFISRFLKLEPSEQLFIYVNQSFAPSPDQEVGVLFESAPELLAPFLKIQRNYLKCFGSDGKLVLHYCKSQAWG